MPQFFCLFCELANGIDPVKFGKLFIALKREEFTMKVKRSLIFMLTVCCTAAVGLVTAPKVVLDSVPTATVVDLEKIGYEDSVTVAGTVARDLIDDSVTVKIYVPEQDISAVKVGQSAEITGDAFPDIIYHGTVDKISDVAMKIPSGKTAVEVTVGIADPDKTLKHGYTASVKICTSEPSVMTLIPYEAVGQDDNGEFVYILRNGRAYKRYVETGRELSGGLELITPVAYDERVITVDHFEKDGSAVKFDE